MQPSHVSLALFMDRTSMIHFSDLVSPSGTFSMTGGCFLTWRLSETPSDTSQRPETPWDVQEDGREDNGFDCSLEEPAMTSSSVELFSLSPADNIGSGSGWPTAARVTLGGVALSTSLESISFGLLVDVDIKRYKTFAGCPRMAGLYREDNTSVKTPYIVTCSL